MGQNLLKEDGPKGFGGQGGALVKTKSIGGLHTVEREKNERRQEGEAPERRTLCGCLE